MTPTTSATAPHPTTSAPTTSPPRARRALAALLLVLGLLGSGLALVASPLAAGPAAAARVVSDDVCRRIDPNLVRGVCLRYEVGGRTGHTWLGTYRAPDGSVFFCIDWLYDSRLPVRADLLPTDDLRNQLGQRVGDDEVAALNYLVSRWAGRGSTGSDARDAAVALIIRQVMSDGERREGVVYPRGLEVGEQVEPPVGGLPGPVLPLARSMWAEASRWRGPYRLELDTAATGPVRLGRSRGYTVSVRSAAGRRVPDVRVTFTCTGPVRCPRAVTSARRPVRVTVKPRALGRFRVRATATGPAAGGRLYVAPGWRGHPGDHARNAGVQRGWIAGSSTAAAQVGARAQIQRARPRVVTETSDAEVRPGAAIHDVVRVSGAPRGYRATATALLFGPYPAQPGRQDCRPEQLVGRVTFPVAGNGTYRTPPVVVRSPGYYTWVQRLPGNATALPVVTPCGLVPETTLVRKAVPVVTTRVSTQTATVGASLRDTVTVAGVGDAPVSVHWTLHGPVPPRAGGCSGIPWAAAGVAARGTLPVPGDGTYVTAPTRVRVGGCYTYSARVPGTALTEPASHPAGIAVQTALVQRRTPRVRTEASVQRALVGDVVRDRIWVSGLPPWAAVTVRWQLHGPLAPRPDGSCRRLDWSGSPVADTGVFVARRDGRHSSGATRIAAPGCYTYGARLPATGSTEPVVHEPGLPLETVLALRPSVPYVPEVPTGPAPDGELTARGPVRLVGRVAEPTAVVPTARAVPRHRFRRYQAPAALVQRAAGSRLVVPSVGIDAPVHAVGLDRGAMAVPGDPGRVGWLSGSAAAGDVTGGAVLSGHVSSRSDRPGALWRLREVKVGQRVVWSGGGREHTYVVTAVRRHPRSTGVPADLFRTDGPARLHLVTCTRRVGTDTGFHYTHNLVVTARRVDPR